MQHSLVTIFFVFITLCAHPQIWTQKGFDINGEQANDRSGYSVSMPDANTVAIGAPFNDGTATSAGHVVVYHLTGNIWVQKGADIEGEASGDESGYSVSMPDANTVAIGAPQNNNVNGVDAGQVRVYRWNGSIWAQKGADIDGEATDDVFGWSVSMPDSNTVAISSPENSGSMNNQGSVRIYTWNGSAWMQKGGDIDGESAGDLSGISVSMPDANTVAIGAERNSANAGHVRIYTWNGSVWIQKGSDIDGESALENSGYSVSMPDANTVAIGAPFSNSSTGASSAGQARIFIWNGSAWIKKGNSIDGEVASDLSGISVSMPDANTVAIGAHRNDGSATDAGHVRIYSWNGSAWIQNGADINGEAADDVSGFSVSMPDANTVAVGAMGNDGNGFDSGHVRVYGSMCSPSTSSVNTSACSSYTSPSGNEVWTSSGSYNDTLLNSSGCDSVLTINLTIHQPTSGSFSESICNGESYFFNGADRTMAGAYSDTLLNAVNCDSIVTLNLNVNPPTNATLNITQCFGSSYFFNNQNLTTAGTYYDTLTNAANCDSLVTLNLSFNSYSAGSFSENICAGESYAFNNQNLTASGAYNDTLSASGGCDSIVTLNLTVNALPQPVISQSNDTLNTGSFSSYEWYLNNIAISNSNTQQLQITQNGDYTVIVTDANGCSDTSAVFNATGVGVGYFPVSDLQALIYPNPTFGNFVLEFSDDTEKEVVITDMLGRTVVTTTSVGARKEFTLHEHAAGLYILQVVQNNQMRILKFCVIKN